MVDNNFNNMKVLAKCQMDVHIGHNAFAGTLHEHNIYMQCSLCCANYPSTILSVSLYGPSMGRDKPSD